MAESTLSLTLTDIRNEVCRAFGCGETYSSSASTDQSRIDRVIARGYRRFLTEEDWQFLKPIATLTTDAPYSTGTVTIVAGVVTLSGGTFPSWAAQGDLTVGGVTYSVNTRDGNTQVTLNDLTVAASAGSTYSLHHNEYTMDDDFAAISGDIYFAMDSFKPPIKLVNIGQIVSLRAVEGRGSAYPLMAAVESDGTAGTSTEGQRFKLTFYPSPDAAYVLRYRKIVNVSNMDASTNPYPVGGMQHAETVLAACLAVAETYFDPDGSKDRLEKRYQELLKRSIAIDGRQNSGDYFGYNGDGSMTAPLRLPRFQTVTYNGVSY